MYFDGAILEDFPNEDLIALNPTDVNTSDLTNFETDWLTTKPTQNKEIKPSFPRYFYDLDQFKHKFSRYFYKQMQLLNYDFIKMRDELIDYNCHSNSALDQIFNTDLHFNIDLPRNEKVSELLLNFCKLVFNELYLNDVD